MSESKDQTSAGLEGEHGKIYLLTRDQWRVIFALCGAWCIVLGVRLALIVRFGSYLPIEDEWGFYDFLQAWRHGRHDWSALFERHGQHFPFMSRLSQVATLTANDLWEPRFQSLVHAIIFSMFALATLSILARAVGWRSGLKVIGIGCLFFIVPFSGYRVTWSFLDANTYGTLFSVLAVYLVVYRPWGVASEIVAAVLVFLAAFSLGSGCLLGFAVAAFLGVRRLMDRKLFWSELALSAYGVAIFVVMMIKVRGGGGGGSGGMDLRAVAVTFLNSLAWPTVFFWPAGLLAFLPFLILTFRFAQGKYRGSPGVACVVLLGFLVAMQCAGISMFRSDNDGMPSNRYNDVLLLAPLVNLCALLFLFQSLRNTMWIRWLGLVWILLTIGGSAANILWRTWPFLARENGEWYDWAKQLAVRRLAETGDLRAIPEIRGGKLRESVELIDAKQLQAILKASSDNSVLTQGSLVGVDISLEAGGKGFKEASFPPEYYAYPYFRYWGSYAEEGELATGSFLSEPFVVHAPYLVFDLIVYKRARFSRYALTGLSLSVIDVQSGVETQLLPQLRSRFPFVFRDRETVYVRVEKGRQYRVKAVDTSNAEWFAFSQPWEGGRLTWFTQTLLDSGKVIILCGLVPLAIAFYPLGSRSESDGDVRTSNQPSA
jgi:hypothetical protein